MSSRVCVAGHIKDAVPLIEKSRPLYPGGRFPSNFIITGLNRLYDCIYVLALKDDLKLEFHREHRTHRAASAGPRHIVTSTSGFSVRCRPMRPIFPVEFHANWAYI